MFVYALSQGTGANEEFKFIKSIYTRNSDIKNFDEELSNGNISLDLVMHKKPNGSIRDHGFLFKISKQNIFNLFREVSEFKLI